MEFDKDGFLAHAAARARTDPVVLTIRELLAYWYAERRGFRIVNQINRDLLHAGLTTDPPFTEGWIDNTVRMVPYGQSPSEVLVVAEEQAHPTDLRATLRVGSLSSANTGIKGVPMDATLALAQSLMLRYDYSQLAIMSGERNLRGAISWESIAQARLRNADSPLQDAIVHAEPVDLDQDLLALVPAIVDKGFLFVRAPDQRIVGIVTMADLSLEFASLARPFFSIGEIERRLRRIIGEKYDQGDMESVRAPDDVDREVRSADDLTFGEYLRLLEEPDRWAKLRWSIDRATFIAALNDVREVRNEVMHFSPDPLSSDQVLVLTNFIKLLKTLDPRV